MIDVLEEIAANLNKLYTLSNCYLIISTSMGPQYEKKRIGFIWFDFIKRLVCITIAVSYYWLITIKRIGRIIVYDSDQ